MSMNNDELERLLKERHFVLPRGLLGSFKNDEANIFIEVPACGIDKEEVE